jgi:hypothetical protein
MILDTIDKCGNGKVKISACLVLEKVVGKMGREELEDNVVLHEAMRVLAAAFKQGPGAAFRDQKALEAQLKSTFLVVEGKCVGEVLSELREQMRI